MTHGYINGYNMTDWLHLWLKHDKQTGYIYGCNMLDTGYMYDCNMTNRLVTFMVKT